MAPRPSTAAALVVAGIGLAIFGAGATMLIAETDATSTPPRGHVENGRLQPGIERNVTFVASGQFRVVFLLQANGPLEYTLQAPDGKRTTGSVNGDAGHEQQFHDATGPFTVRLRNNDPLFFLPFATDYDLAIVEAYGDGEGDYAGEVPSRTPDGITEMIAGFIVFEVGGVIVVALTIWRKRHA